eukprot:1974010-Pleurochrysis_carterae.AAC.1
MRSISATSETWANRRAISERHAKSKKETRRVEQNRNRSAKSISDHTEARVSVQETYQART